MDSKKEAATTGKVAIPQAVREEIELVFFMRYLEKLKNTKYHIL